MIEIDEAVVEEGLLVDQCETQSGSSTGRCWATGEALPQVCSFALPGLTAMRRPSCHPRIEASLESSTME